MTKSDQELGDLLRETFTDKEFQADRLLAANKSPGSPAARVSTGRAVSGRRRFVPVLAGAAAVVLVVAAAVIIRENVPHSTDLQAPAATPSAPGVSVGDPLGLALTDDERIWAAAIKGIIDREPGAATYYVLDAPQQNGASQRGKPFTNAEKSTIANQLAPIKLEWITKRPPLPDPCAPDAGGPYVTVGKIVHQAGHVEVDASIWRGCLAARWLTFRLDEKAGEWKVTGTVGPEAVS
ncbi:hypothetical protein [Kribbella sp. NPDC051770]|uniref:hypothetical protein n=1 Tax=Kribbella sp. NPDC051770 TaxID=3155413 RepID=UPI00342CEE89